MFLLIKVFIIVIQTCEQICKCNQNYILSEFKDVNYVMK